MTSRMERWVESKEAASALRPEECVLGEDLAVYVTAHGVRIVTDNYGWDAMSIGFNGAPRGLFKDLPVDKVRELGRWIRENFEPEGA